MKKIVKVKTKNKLKNAKKEKRAFTLLELLAVIGILAIILIIAVPKINNVLDQVKERAFLSSARIIVEAIDSERARVIGFDVSTINAGNIDTIVDVDKTNYSTIVATVVSNSTNVNIVGAGKYNGITVAGTKETLAVVPPVTETTGTLLAMSNFGGSAIDAYYGISTVVGGYVAVGESRSADYNLVGMNQGDYDALIVKYDNNNNVLWSDTFGGLYYDCYKNAVEVSDGIVAVGVSKSTNGDLLGSGSVATTDYSDALIVKYDLAGAVLWRKVLRGTYSESFQDIAPADDSGVVVVGDTSSNDYDVPNFNYGVNGQSNATIVKYDSSGNVVWKKYFGGNNGSNRFTDIVKVSDGYIVAGYGAATTLDMVGLRYDASTTVGDPILVKFDFSGNVVWKKHFGGTKSDNFNSVDVVSDGLIVTGEASSTDYDLVGMNKGSSDAIIVKYDFTGNVLWKKNIGGANGDSFLDAVGVSDGYLAVGFSWSSTLDFAGLNKGSSDAIMVKYDFAGTMVWKKNYGGLNLDQHLGIAKVGSSYIVAGMAYSNDSDYAGKHYGLTTVGDATISVY